MGGQELNCAIQPASDTWAEVVAAGCDLPQITIGRQLGNESIQKLYDDLGLFSVPSLDQTSQETMDVPIIRSPEDVILGQTEFRVSPLQMALAATTISAGGVRPSPVLATAIDLPEQGWTVFPPSGEFKQVFSQPNAEGIANSLADDHLPIWQSISRTPNESGQMVTWYLAGTLPSWTGAPFSLVVLLEEDDPEAALAFGQVMMKAALQIE
jgi:membrane peptidoglycan carboxypeptidase